MNHTLFTLCCAFGAPLALVICFAVCNRLDDLFPEPFSASRHYRFQLCSRRYVESRLGLLLTLMAGGLLGFLVPKFLPEQMAQPLTVFLIACGVLAVVDGARQFLPDVLTLPLIAGGLLVNGVYGAVVPAGDAVMGMIFGAALLEVPRQVLLYWKGDDGIGGGDVKYLAAVGAWLGLCGLLLTAITAFALFLVWGVCRRRRAMEALPMGPWISAGAALAICWGVLYA